jgi:hypothetical protein
MRVFTTRRTCDLTSGIDIVYVGRNMSFKSESFARCGPVNPKNPTMLLASRESSKPQISVIKQRSANKHDL